MDKLEHRAVCFKSVTGDRPIVEEPRKALCTLICPLQKQSQLAVYRQTRPEWENLKLWPPPYQEHAHRQTRPNLSDASIKVRTGTFGPPLTGM